MRHALTTAVLFLLCVVPSAVADTITMSSGRTIEGVVLREDPDSIVIKLEHGTMTLPRTSVAKVVKSTPVPTPSNQATITTAKERFGGTKFAPWDQTVTTITREKWATNFQQIPATVVDIGVLANVPYQSYRFGPEGGFELNVYGDPDAPAGVEIGLYGDRAKDSASREQCIRLMVALLGNATDAAIATAVDRDKDLITRGNLTFEITPQSAPDSYGAWWISVYDTNTLDKVRATAAELAAISIARTPPPSTPKPQSQQMAPTPEPDPAQWSGADLERARSTSSSIPSTGRVYVRGYQRRDGTYVRPYTRSR